MQISPVGQKHCRDLYPHPQARECTDHSVTGNFMFTEQGSSPKALRTRLFANQLTPTQEKPTMTSSQHLKLNACNCGRIHLTYGSVTLHFTKEEFLAYAMYVGKMATHVSSTAGLQMAGGFTDAENTNCH